MYWLPSLSLFQRHLSGVDCMDTCFMRCLITYKTRKGILHRWTVARPSHPPRCSGAPSSIGKMCKLYFRRYAALCWGMMCDNRFQQQMRIRPTCSKLSPFLRAQHSFSCNYTMHCILM